MKILPQWPRSLCYWKGSLVALGFVANATNFQSPSSIASHHTSRSSCGLTRNAKDRMMSGKVFFALFAMVAFLLTGCGGRSGSTSAANPDPSGSTLALTSVTPDSAEVANPVTVQVTGTGFDSSSVIVLNGNSVATTFVNSTTVNTTLPATAATQPTAANVAVSNTSSNQVSNVLKFYWLGPLVITSTALAPATQGSGYQVTLTATGGKAPYNWTVTGGLPTGLAMSSSGTISGTPVSSGNYSVSLTVTDSSSRALSAQATLALQVTPAALNIPSVALPSGTVSKAYSGTLTAAGGTSPYKWSVSSGSLPAGLSLASATGVITGTPTSSGTSSFTVSVSDSSSPVQTQSAATSIVIAAAPVSQLAIGSSALPSGTVSKAYSGTLTAAGGTSPYKWSVSSGSLPAGLSLASATGAITGTPTSSGTSSFTVSVSDSSSPVQTQSAATSIVIAAAPVSQLTIGSSALPSGTVSKAYSGTLTAAGGTSPYKWSVSSGSLPAGLSLASATGAITGTPTSSGTSSFTVSVSDSSSPVQTQSAATSIVTVSALQITTTTLPNGAEGSAYSATLSATGGTPPYTWSLGSGSFPSSLALAATSGSISGSPTTSGTFTPTVQVTDSANNSATESFSFTISAPAYWVLLDWTASPSTTVTGYNVYRSATNGSGYAKINPSPVGGTAYTDATVVDGQVYYYAVTSVDAAGDESAFSEDVQMSIP